MEFLEFPVRVGGFVRVKDIQCLDLILVIPVSHCLAGPGHAFSFTQTVVVLSCCIIPNLVTTWILFAVCYFSAKYAIHSDLHCQKCHISIELSVSCPTQMMQWFAPAIPLVDMFFYFQSKVGCQDTQPISKLRDQHALRVPNEPFKRLRAGSVAWEQK